MRKWCLFLFLATEALQCRVADTSLVTELDKLADISLLPLYEGGSRLQ
jgi:hypothetical protein